MVQVSTAGGWSPIWSIDGGELFYRSDNDSFHAASIRFDGTTISSGNPTLLFDQRDYASSGPTGTWSVGPDGRFSIRGRADEAVMRQAVEGMYPPSILRS